MIISPIVNTINDQSTHRHCRAHSLTYNMVYYLLTHTHTHTHTQNIYMHSITGISSSVMLNSSSGPGSGISSGSHGAAMEAMKAMSDYGELACTTSFSFPLLFISEDDYNNFNTHFLF